MFNPPRIDQEVRDLANADVDRQQFNELRASRVICMERECSICFEEYEPNDQILIIKSCKHFFHYKCFESWFRNS